MHYDVYERHKKIGSLIKNGDTVVDIGGELNHLALFCKPKEIIVANLKTGDVIISKDKLPFKNNSFDVVCAIDVLEHIPKNKRKKFITNLTAIAKKKAIFSFPLGTKKHVEHETKMLKWLEKIKENVTYLKEHQLYGLPTKEDLKKYFKSNSKIFYSGNITLNEHLFKLQLFDPKIKYVRKIIYVAKNLFFLLTNPVFYRLLSNREYQTNVNRAYVVINKK